MILLEGTIGRDVSQKQAIERVAPAPPDAIVAAHVMCMSGEEKGSTLFWRARTQREASRSRISSDPDDGDAQRHIWQ